MAAVLPSSAFSCMLRAEPPAFGRCDPGVGGKVQRGAGGRCNPGAQRTCVSAPSPGAYPVPLGDTCVLVPSLQEWLSTCRLLMPFWLAQ